MPNIEADIQNGANELTPEERAQIQSSMVEQILQLARDAGLDLMELSDALKADQVRVTNGGISGHADKSDPKNLEYSTKSRTIVASSYHNNPI